MQPTLFGSVQWTVTTLTRHIREALESDPELQDVWVEGEVSNLSRPASGHMYFTLKDASASLRCVMWKSGVARLGRPPQDGSAIAVHGRIGVYDAGGQYQLYVEEIRAVGEGALYQEFVRLKAALEAEGLFAIERKRPVPPLPGRIGLITSPTGAALRDVLQTLRRRLPLAEVILAGSAMQGESAPSDLVSAISQLNRLQPRPDVILLVRGGGSIEDLWAFNDERVVRAVAASETPLVCGVGHETDFTLSDFAADLRAPTPTAAAELATSITILELKESVDGARRGIANSVLNLLAEYRNQALAAGQSLRYQSPLRRIQADRQRIDEFARRASAGEAHRLSMAASELDGLNQRLGALSPLQVLARGYAVVTRRADGRLVRKLTQARGRLGVRVSDGEFTAEVVTDRGTA
jgi:exodeoxyribonuclease VII large subunit